MKQSRPRFDRLSDHGIALPVSLGRLRLARHRTRMGNDREIIKEVIMPRRDGTGPEGLGSMTGRAMGYCAGYPAPGFTNLVGRGLARGRGRGIGRGMAWGRKLGYYAPAYYPPVAPPTPEQEKAALQNQIKFLKEETEALQHRLDELGKG